MELVCESVGLTNSRFSVVSGFTNCSQQIKEPLIEVVVPGYMAKVRSATCTTSCTLSWNGRLIAYNEP